MVRTVTRAAGIMLLTLAVLRPAAAQVGPFAIGVKASTLGIGPEVAVHLAGPLALRASKTSYTRKANSEEEGIAYQIEGKLRGTSLLLDLHPTHGAFHLTGGMVLNTPTVNMVAINTSGVKIGEHTYTPSEVSRLDGSIHGKKNGAYVGLGFDKSVFTKSRVAFGFEMGVVMIGTPKPLLTVTSNFTGAQKAELDQQLQEEIDELQDKINDLPSGLKYFPVIGFSLKVRI